MSTMQLTDHERTEWNRCASALADRNSRLAQDTAAFLRKVAERDVLPSNVFDAASAMYRKWLRFDLPKGRTE